MAFNIKKKITDFHYGKKSALLTALFILPTVFYFLFINIKNFLYKINFLKETVVEPFIICVGNLTTGGVGKTPVVIELANFLAEKNLKVAILSRGYQGKLDNKKVNLIKNFDEILIDDPILSGDEVNLISKKTKNVVVVTSSEATLYVIQPNKTLKAVGSSVVTDNKTISTVDGTLSLKDFGVQYYAYIPGEDSQPGSWAESPTSGFKAGLEPKIRQVSAGQYELAWYEPATDTTAGLQSAVAQLQQDVSNLQTQVSEIPTWEDIESST